jgi:surfeit locus 1 family protein
MSRSVRAGNRAERRFRPPWWATLGALLLATLFASLGAWQLSRAAEKRAYLGGFDSGQAAAPVAAPGPGGDPDAWRYRRIVASGRYDHAHQVLLDARLRDGRAGYEVLTPLLRDDRAVLVNRGWVPAEPDRARLPPVAVGGEARTVEGLLDRLPVAALATGAGEEAQTQTWPRRMLFPTAARIEAALGYPVEDYQLLLDPDQPDGFDRDWRPAVMTPQQHLGYAVQWFALAATVVVIYAVLGFRKRAAIDG